MWSLLWLHPAVSTAVDNHISLSLTSGDCTGFQSVVDPAVLTSTIVATAALQGVTLTASQVSVVVDPCAQPSTTDFDMRVQVASIGPQDAKDVSRQCPLVWLL